MSLLGFKKQFAGPVEDRTKRQTIRAKCQGHQVGRAIQLYTGLRTKACRKLAEVDPICTSIEAILISIGGVVRVGNVWLTDDEINALASFDGFASATAFFEFFKPAEGTAFNGFLIKWDWP